MPSSVHCMQINGSSFETRPSGAPQDEATTALMVRSVAKPRASNHEGESHASSILRKLQPHGAVSLRILAPPFTYFDEQKQVYFGVRSLRDIPAGGLPDGLDRLPALAENDLALAFALDIDRLFDPDVAAA